MQLCDLQLTLTDLMFWETVWSWLMIMWLCYCNCVSSTSRILRCFMILSLGGKGKSLQKMLVQMVNRLRLNLQAMGTCQMEMGTRTMHLSCQYMNSIDRYCWSLSLSYRKLKTSLTLTTTYALFCVCINFCFVQARENSTSNGVALSDAEKPYAFSSC